MLGKDIPKGEAFPFSLLSLSYFFFFTPTNLSLKFARLAELEGVNWCLGHSQSRSVHRTSPDHSCPTAGKPKALTRKLLS